MYLSGLLKCFSACDPFLQYKGTIWSQHMLDFEFIFDHCVLINFLLLIICVPPPYISYMIPYVVSTHSLRS